ncbi:MULTISPECIES: segregation/condensation protein A [Paenibacillus]|uniref:Segregation and condensation protein A n=1 Tax=Paenibacillus etheri TaxID=1306852 RepID=A0A0W1B0H2_9BACL|nr:MULTISPECIES: segregation/condensation protein A [Paenibacillus]AIQ36910.1 segregation and condensation protein A [Paenibacillus sp. FSL R5-0345]KTD87121.1 segregation and condensation protein A [Paenibacillus etheri]
MTVLYKLETFEGPLDLLLHLIDKAEIDIQDIPVAEITEQYMEYLRSMQELELDITSEFLVMAATLLSIKSKLLLPKPPVIEIDDFEYYEEDEFDPRAELVQRLIEYRKFKSIAVHLMDMESERSLIFTKEPEDLGPFVPEEIDHTLKGLHTSDLIAAFRKALSKAARRSSYQRITRDEISVKDRIRDVSDALQRRGKGGRLHFSALLHDEMARHEIVVTFLAILELMKMKAIFCYQEKLFEDIVMEWRGGEHFNGLQNAEIDY